AEATFTILSPTSSLLSATLAPGVPLYTRSGTLVGLSGTNTRSITKHLHILSPLLRSLTLTPWLYQRVTSAGGYSALIGTRSAMTSMSVLNLDGREDWNIIKKNAILAWAGEKLALTPSLTGASRGTSLLSHAISLSGTEITGRGLVAVVGKGALHQINLKNGEEYILRRGNVVGYTLTCHPERFSFESKMTLRVPDLFTHTRFWTELRKTGVYRFSATLGGLVGRVWGWVMGEEPYFLFRGPGRVIFQSRGTGVRDLVT
ncbi:hypothetical protein K470DRAFT_206313, partial [Piedraia hortae CBS 480.64]